MLEIRNEKLVINGKVIGDEEKLINIFEKAIKYDEMKPIFEEINRERIFLKNENHQLTKRLQNVTFWDSSEVEKERAGRALAHSLTGGA